MQRNLEEENKQSSIGTEMFGRVLCKVLSGNMFKTEFYFEGVEPVNTSKQIKTAVDNLRLFIQQGSWTNNDFQRFVIMNLELSSTEIARVYQKKQYKEASVRTTKRRALEKLSSIIDVQYLNCFLLNSDLDPKEQYKLQRVACRYLKYLNSKHLNNSLFPKEVTEALLRYHQSSEIFDVKDCNKEIMFLALYYFADFDRSIQSLDPAKLGYVSYVLNKCNDLDNLKEYFEFVLMFEKAVKQYRKEVFYDK